MERIYDYIYPELIELLLVAAFSLFIGLSQRRLTLKSSDVTQFGTDRTFTFIGILGYLFYRLDASGLSLFLYGGAALVVFLGLNYALRMVRHEEYGLTRILIALIVYSLGPVVCTQPLWFSISVVVLVLLLTELKQTFTEIARKMQRDEMITLAKFLFISGIVLPLLPDDELLPGTGLTPYLVWLATVVVSAISYFSYLLKHYVFPQAGLLLSAVLGGMYSSTATISVLARKCKSADGADLPRYAAAISAAVSTRYVRFLVLIAIFNAEIFWKLLPYLLPLALFSGVLAAWLLRRRRASGEKPLSPEAAAEAEAREVAAENPLEFKVALIFTALFVLFTLLTYWVMQYGGRYGMSLLSVASGVSDITPFVLNLLGHDSVLPARQIGICVLQALASNVVVNMGYAYFFSGRRRDFVPQLRLVFLPVLVLHLLLLGVFYII